jgi:hypothetical protein
MRGARPHGLLRRRNPRRRVWKSWFPSSLPGTAPTMIIARPAVSVSDTVSPPALPTTTCASATRAGMSRSKPITRADVPETSVAIRVRNSSDAPQMTVSSTFGKAAHERTMSRSGPTPKPPLVTSTRRGSPDSGSRTGAMFSNARRTGIPVLTIRERSTPCISSSHDGSAAAVQNASMPRSAHTACAV